MLQRIKVKNYAIIDELEISFSPHLNIITGETGAGKSILLGALGLILGNRADSKTFYRVEEKCIIEAEFRIEAYNLQSWFEDNDLDYAGQTLVRREIQQSGKNRVFINDTPCNLQQLQDFTGRLVDIHQQFSLFDLQKPAYQLELYDAYAGNTKLREEYQVRFKKLNALLSSRAQLETEKNRALTEMDFVHFQLEELQSLNLGQIDQQALEEELKLIEHAGNIRQVTSSIYEALSGDEQNVVNSLTQLSQQLSPIAGLSVQLTELSERLYSTKIELQELSDDILQVGESTEIDDERATVLRDNLDQLYKMLQKHHANSAEELTQIFQNLENKSTDFDLIDQKLATIDKEIATLRRDLGERAEALHQNRKKSVPAFQSSILKQVKSLGMPHASFEVSLMRSEELTSKGIDTLEFLFSANKGNTPAPIRDVASGGEISRLTLVIKSLVAASIPLPTLIYDEIDTGLGGEIALKMAGIMQQLAKEHQVIVITHSPQIAAKADKHLFVYKEVIKNNTFTQIKTLDLAERIEAIAIMLSTRPPSEAAIANAKELIN